MRALKRFACALRQLAAGKGPEPQQSSAQYTPLANLTAKPGSGSASPLPRPAVPVCIIGDLHGRLDLLEKMLTLIAARKDTGQHRIIFAGDMIDRGPGSAGILRRLHALNETDPQRIICLMGNHERMMLDFLADPPRHGPRWLASGGNETLVSFGCSPWARSGATNAAERLHNLAASFAAALPAGLADWLAALPLIWCEDMLAVTHAGADPARPITAQSVETLLWGHPAFLRQPRRDGFWVAHGHTIVAEAKAEAGRISLDTGAWRTGRLSAAWLSKVGLEFIEASQEQP